MSFSKPSGFVSLFFIALVLAVLLACASSQQGEKPGAVIDEAALREQARADSIKAARQLEIRKIKSTASEYHKNKQYTDAIPHLEKALQLDSQNEGAYFMLADCYFRLDNLDQAVEVYKRAISQDPQNGNFHQYLGYMLDRKGLAQEAMTEYEKAV
ncbi:tetratricopeptide repeat protein, partial [bacterium]|nr:tetratricopeptide repeat protein [bacterium]